MKTLVIHPSDPSTKFLSAIYAERDWTVYSESGDFGLSKALESHDRIIMMGHGGPNALFNRHLNYLIDGSYARVLREKSCVGIWCHANEFFNHYKINGPHTGMIVSELNEWEFLFESVLDRKHILESNPLFAEAVRQAILSDNFRETVLDLYRSDSNNPVIEYNRNNIFNGINP